MSTDSNQQESNKTFWAFISYSSLDKKWGAWMHKKLENYPIPSDFQGEELFDGAVLGKNLRPIFRDRDELSGSAELGPAIMEALEKSRFLIVLCSKNSAKSEWVNKEIEDFKTLKQGNGQRILALIIDGEPNATSSNKSDSAEECFPPALRYPLEPLAGDLRKEGDGKERGFLKVLAGITQLSFDKLYRRHERAQQKKRVLLGITAVTIIALLSFLTIFALNQKKEAETQKGIAEENATEASAQRDLARENEKEAKNQQSIAQQRLGRFYFEKSLNSNSNSHAVAWAIHAAKNDPDLIDQPHFQFTMSGLLGEWQHADQAISTQKQHLSGSELIANDAPLIFSKHKTVLIRKTESAWHLMNWETKESIHSAVFPEIPIGFFRLTDTDAFAIIGRRKVEIRSVKSGKTLYSLREEDAIDDVCVTGNHIIYLTKNDLAKQCYLTLLNTKNQSKKTITIPDLTVSLESVHVRKNKGQYNVAIVTNKTPSKLHVYRINAAWDTISAVKQCTTDATYLYSRPRKYDNGIYAIGSRDPDKVSLLDLNTSTLLATSLRKSDTLLALTYYNTIPHALITSQKDEEQRATLINLHTSEENTLCTIGKRDKVEFNALTQEIVFSKDGENKICIIDKSFNKRWITLPAYSNSTYQVSEFKFNHADLLCLKMYTDMSLIIDQYASDKPHFYALGGDIHTPLSFTKKTNQHISAIALTHEQTALSYFHSVPPLESLVKQTLSEQHEHSPDTVWTSINDQGKWLSLSRKRESGTNHLTFSNSTNKSTKPCSLKYVDYKLLVDLGLGYQAILNPEKSILYDTVRHRLVSLPSGIERASVKITRIDEKDCVIYQREGFLICQDISTEKQLWKKTLRTGISDSYISEDNESYYFTIIKNSDWNTKTSAFFHLSLLEVDVSTGEHLQTAKWEAPELEVERLTKGIYSRKLRIIAGEKPCLHFKTKSSNPSLMDNTLFVPATDKLNPISSYKTDNDQLSFPLTPISTGGFLVNSSNTHAGKRTIAHFFIGPNKQWQSKEILLAEKIKNVSVSPSGSKCLITTSNSSILWNLKQHKQIGAKLSTSNYDLNTQGHALWSEPNNILLLWDHNSIQLFDSESGRHLKHSPYHISKIDYDDIEHAAISPNGKHLISVRQSGLLTTSKLSFQTRSLEKLEHMSHMLRQHYIDHNDGIQKWSPPATP